jgi:hypothetical protein
MLITRLNMSRQFESESQPFMRCSELDASDQIACTTLGSRALIQIRLSRKGLKAPSLLIAQTAWTFVPLHRGDNDYRPRPSPGLASGIRERMPGIVYLWKYRCGSVEGAEPRGACDAISGRNQLIFSPLKYIHWKDNRVAIGLAPISARARGKSSNISPFA